jgi:ketosteroid isomerase-like protein
MTDPYRPLDSAGGGIMSEVARNRAAVLAFVDIVNEEGFPAAVASLDEDARWWIGGVDRGKAEMSEVIGRVAPMLASWGRYEVTAITAEEDRVALETVSHATLADGRPYSNSYHFLFRLRDGRIVQIREHCDTRYAAEVMSGLAAA